MFSRSVPYVFEIISDVKDDSSLRMCSVFTEKEEKIKNIVILLQTGYTKLLTALRTRTIMK